MTYEESATILEFYYENKVYRTHKLRSMVRHGTLDSLKVCRVYQMLYLRQERGAGTNTALLRCVKQLLSAAL